MTGKIVLLENTPENGNFPYIRFLRGLGILSIVLFHDIWGFMTDAPRILRGIMTPFGYSTRIFFFCSGFGLYYSYLKNPRPYSDFLRRRFLNVYLPYIGAVLICALAPYTYEHNDRLGALLSHVFLYKMFIPSKTQSFGPFWFMSAIFLYYFLFYALVRMKKAAGSSRRFLLFWIFVSLIYCAAGSLIPALHTEYYFVYSTLPLMHGWIFALGMNTAEALFREGNVALSGRWLAAFTVISIPVYVFTELKTAYMKEIPQTLMILGLFTLLWAASANRKTFRSLVDRFASFSFEWYLLHMLVLQGMFGCFRPAGFFRQLLVGSMGFGLSILAAWLYHMGIGLVRNRIGHPKEVQ